MAAYGVWLVVQGSCLSHGCRLRVLAFLLQTKDPLQIPQFLT